MSFDWLGLSFSFSYFNLFIILIIAIALWLILDSIREYLNSKLYWTWDNGGDGVETPRKQIDTDDIFFPENFMWGVATSAHQSEGGCTSCQWVNWENSVDPNGKSHIKDNSTSPQTGTGHWDHVDEDIELMSTLGVNAYRFSIEWSKVEPERGRYDESVLAHYHREIDLLISAGINPMITILHFVHPQWFEDLGSYEHEENLVHLINFAKKLFQEFAPKVKYWCTINEPFFAAFGGWMMGSSPPGKRDQALCGLVLRNLLEAHVQIYTSLKAMKGAAHCQIGIVIAVYFFDAWNKLNFGDINCASSLHSMFNESTINFLKDGVFSFRHPQSALPIKHINLSAPKSNDFIGLNYYSHSFVAYTFNILKPVQIMVPPTALMSDGVNAALYPEGLYRAISLVSSLNLPIIITENGCADSLDDRRHLFIRRHLYVVSKAIRDGFRVIGYFYWSLLDNFEWSDGYTHKYGLFEVITPNTTSNLSLYSNHNNSSNQNLNNTLNSTSRGNGAVLSRRNEINHNYSSRSSREKDKEKDPSQSSGSGSSSGSGPLKTCRTVRLRDGAKAYMKVIYRFTGRGQYPIFALNNIVQGSIRKVSNSGPNNSINSTLLRKSSSMGRMSAFDDPMPQTVYPNTHGYGPGQTGQLQLDSGSNLSQNNILRQRNSILVDA